MAINFIQSKSSSTTITTPPGLTVVSGSVTLTSNVTFGNTLVIAISTNIGTGFNGGGISSPFSISDTLGNTYKLVDWLPAVLFQPGLWLYYVPLSNSGSCTITFQVSAQNNNPTFTFTESLGIAVAEVSGFFGNGYIQGEQIGTIGVGSGVISINLRDSHGTIIDSFTNSTAQTTLGIMDLANNGADFFVGAYGIASATPGTLTESGGTWSYTLQESIANVLYFYIRALPIPTFQQPQLFVATP